MTRNCTVMQFVFLGIKTREYVVGRGFVLRFGTGALDRVEVCELFEFSKSRAHVFLREAKQPVHAEIFHRK